jgi:hypothetical protein
MARSSRGPGGPVREKEAGLRILVTTSRMPFAVDAIRKLGQRDHALFAADSFRLAPGNHSALVHRALKLPPPRFAPDRFIDAVAAAVAEHGIELLLPTFEESFVLAKQRARFEPGCRLFAADFELLARLHHKARFFELLDEVGLPAPPTETVTDRVGLQRAVGRQQRWVARAAYSRGAVDVLTHAGPVAGELSLDDCRPSADNPWIVQPFVDGQRLCCYSLAHRGRVSAHCAYAHPRTLEGGGGISFESIAPDETLALVRRLVAATGYHGQLSLDLIRAADGLYALECNPRMTDGVVLMAADEFERGLLAPQPGAAVVVPAGRRRQITAGLLRELLAHFGRMLAQPGELRQALSELVHIPGVYGAKDDPGPALVLPLSYSHVIGYKRHQRRSARSRSSIAGAYLYDVSWNGEPLP